MKRDREELLDFLLGELGPDRSHAVAQRIAADPDAAADRDHYLATMDLIRAAAADGWEAPAARPRLRALRPALAATLAAAAVLLVAVAIFFFNRDALHPSVVFDPDGAFGYLLAEEVDADGGVRVPAAGDAFTLRAGDAEAGAIASARMFPLKRGDAIAVDSVVETPADSGARIDMPDGGILFVGRLSSVHVRHHQDGSVALRLMGGSAATVAGARPIHLAVNGTDLLLDQESGATLLRHQPGEAICLRGDLFLRLTDGRFQVPAAERLPAACAKEPATTVIRGENLGLDWYEALVYQRCRCECVVWEKPRRSTAIDAGAATLLYLHMVPTRSGTLEVAFGGEPREFTLRQGVPLKLRLKLADLGPGSRLTLSTVDGLKEARLFDAVPK